MDNTRLWLMAKSFEDQLKHYQSKPFLKMFDGTEFSSQVVTILKKACQIADSVPMDFDLYVKAQFWWFDKAFSKAPSLRQLAYGGKTYTPAVRAAEYAKHFGIVLKDAPPPVAAPLTVSKARSAPKKIKAAKFSMCDAAIKRMMETYNKTEREIFLAFKGKSLTQFFDKQWLRQNKTWQELVIAGEI